jgi:hypothetical protein
MTAKSKFDLPTELIAIYPLASGSDADTVTAIAEYFYDNVATLSAARRNSVAKLLNESRSSGVVNRVTLESAYACLTK